VSDFGIGGIAAGHAISRTRLGTSQGQFLMTALRGAHTPLYASPQQARGEPPDPRDDVHAIGVIWYQMLTGSLTAGRPGGMRWARKLADLGLAPPLIELLGACVEEDAADRPTDAADLAERLAHLLDRPGVEVRKPVPVPADLPRQIVNVIGMKLALVPAGTFRMGSPDDETNRGADEGPQHEVTITRPFYMGIHPVTQREYAAVMGHNPAQFVRASGGSAEHPVEQVSWEDAAAFCRRLSERAEEKKAGRSYRLPTEAEWECACRAGTTTPFSFGSSLSAEQANFDGARPYGTAKPGEARGRTTKVGSFRPNAFGLADMHGNVWEWVSDWYAEDYYEHSPDRDPPGPLRGTRRVLRGGCWNNSGHLCRSARRNKYAPDFRSDTIGFRVVVSV
jgi:formylglycine-generating enzyme required for sulfatase activity